MKRRLSLLTLSALSLTGCVSLQLNNADRLIARPDFPSARAAAPEWCRDALKTINRLESELESK